MPQVSVVTGFYNRGALLERTIESILNQTFEDFELLVFDDNSTDDTAERLAQLSQKYDDPRLRYIVHPENKGFVQGLRDAIDMTTGEYIAIQGSGDASLPRRLELQVKLLDARSGVGAVGGWYTNIQEDQGTRILRTPSADALEFDDLLKTNVFSHGEVMIRRSAYEEVGGYRTAFTYSQDRDLWLRISKVARLATVPENIYDRYVQFGGVSYDPKKRIMQSCYSIAAVRMAQMGPEDEAESLEKLVAQGPTAVVPHSDSTVQRNLVRSALRMMLFGAAENGIEIARDYVRNPLKRSVLVGFGKWYDSRLSIPIRPLVWRITGLKR